LSLRIWLTSMVSSCNPSRVPAYLTVPRARVLPLIVGEPSQSL